MLTADNPHLPRITVLNLQFIFGVLKIKIDAISNDPTDR